MLLKNTGLFYTIRLGGAWATSKKTIIIRPLERLLTKSDTTYSMDSKSFRICKLQRN